MNHIPFAILEETSSSTPFTREDFLGKIFGNIWSLLINLLALVVLFVVLFLVAYKPVKKYVEKRKEYIEHNIHDAETAKKLYEQKAGEGEKIISDAQKEATEIVAKAEINAKKEANSIIADAAKEASRRQEAATEAIRQEEAASRKAIHDEIVNVALEASKELLGREISEEDNKKLIEEFAANIEKEKEA